IFFKARLLFLALYYNTTSSQTSTGLSNYHDSKRVCEVKCADQKVKDKLAQIAINRCKSHDAKDQTNGNGGDLSCTRFTLLAFLLSSWADVRTERARAKLKQLTLPPRRHHALLQQ